MLMLQLYSAAIAGCLFGVMLGCALSQRSAYRRGKLHGRQQGRHEYIAAARSSDAVRGGYSA